MTLLGTLLPCPPFQSGCLIRGPIGAVAPLPGACRSSPCLAYFPPLPAGFCSCPLASTSPSGLALSFSHLDSGTQSESSLSEVRWPPQEWPENETEFLTKAAPATPRRHSARRAGGRESLRCCRNARCRTRTPLGHRRTSCVARGRRDAQRLNVMCRDVYVMPFPSSPRF